MPIFTRGSIVFEKRPIGIESGAAIALRTWDCFPPPKGKASPLKPLKSIPTELISSFLQKRESAALLEGAKKTGERPLTLATLIKDVWKAFKFAPLAVDLTKLPTKWNGPVKCYKVAIALAPTHQVWEINARTNKEIKLAGELYPKGDLVASFRVRQPIYYEFSRSFEFNPKCCPRTKPAKRPPERHALKSEGGGPMQPPPIKGIKAITPPPVRTEGLAEQLGDMILKLIEAEKKRKRPKDEKKDPQKRDK